MNRPLAVVGADKYRCHYDKWSVVVDRKTIAGKRSMVPTAWTSADDLRSYGTAPKPILEVKLNESVLACSTKFAIKNRLWK